MSEKKKKPETNDRQACQNVVAKNGGGRKKKKFMNLGETGRKDWKKFRYRIHRGGDNTGEKGFSGSGETFPKPRAERGGREKTGTKEIW